MRLITSMLYCLLALFGCDGQTSTTTVTRTRIDGQDTLFSRTTQDRDAATFQCVRSNSGRCHYQVFEEHCMAAGQADSSTCARTPLQGFSLAVGDTHLLKGVTGQIRECVRAETPGPDAHCGG